MAERQAIYRLRTVDSIQVLTTAVLSSPLTAVLDVKREQTVDNLMRKQDKIQLTLKII